jgi:PAS domain S-box-containing protein
VITEPVGPPLNSRTESEKALAQKLHDLRTPLNQIIGLSEMLVEIANDDGYLDLLEGLHAIREGGLELAGLLQDHHLITVESLPGKEYWPLNEAVRSAASRILGFADVVLSEPPSVRLEGYRHDLICIRSAAGVFMDLVRASGLLIKLESVRQEEIQSAPELDPSQVSSTAPSSKGSVLIVDDESLNREVLCRRLQREGYRPAGVHSGRAALQILRNEPFDAVLLDIQMPEMSGIEVLQALRQDQELRHLPVIMLSGLTDVERVARCIQLGAEDYLPKPINSVLLRARLGACLEKKRLRDQEHAHLHALCAEKELMSVTLRSLADAVITTDALGQIALLNEVACTMAGVKPEDAIGRSFAEVFPIFQRSTGLPAASIAAEALERNASVESESGVAIKLAGGAERIVSARGAPIHNQMGAARGALVVIRDVTEKERMADELLRASKLQSLGVLAGGLAHDYNNMLTAVLGNLSLIRNRANLSSVALPAIQEAERGAARAQELTRYLLTFAEGGAPMKQVLQPRELIEETSRFVLAGSNVHGEFHLNEDLWRIEADPNQFIQVVNHLVLNAVEASPGAGRIILRAENISTPHEPIQHLPAGDYLRISVQDFGAGIASEHMPRIYDPFFTTKKQARGLGLAAAYSVIQRHGGHITVTSALGSGTTVTFYMPALRPPVSGHGETSPAKFVETPRPIGASAARSVSRKRALVMDDEEAIRLLAEAMLGMLDYEVVTASDGDAALAAHAAAREAGRPFDLTVMDLTVPGGMGGKETIRRLRERDATIRAVVSSGYSNDPIMAHYHDHGFDGVLPKPYVLDDLIAVLARLR